jgi:dihydrolipoamide dehydrogenase
MYDVIVIGGGPGGYAAAVRAAQLGGKVALIEAGQIGGTCVNRGCIPSKVWLRAAYLLHWMRNAEVFGIRATVDPPHLPAIVDRKNGVAADIRTGMEALLNNNQVELIQGRAVFKNHEEIEVEGRCLETRASIVATGSCIDIPDIPGMKDAATTTDGILDMTEVPPSVLVWGDSGPIDIEMATCLRIFGSRVHLATQHPRLLPREDHDTSQRIAQALGEQGVEVLTGHALKSIASSNGGFSAALTGPSDLTVDVSAVLVASRRPYYDGLGIEELGVRLNQDRGIWVDDRLRTSVKGIYAIGDATGGWMTSHAASSMAVSAAENAMGRDVKFPFRLIPRALWTLPQVGSVGLTEEEAENKGFDVDVGSFPYAINGLAMVQNEMTGSVKIVCEAEYGEILGVHIVGAHATELIGEGVMAMQLECTVRELATSIRCHPTYSEAVVDAARDTLDWALYLPRR